MLEAVGSAVVASSNVVPCAGCLSDGVDIKALLTGPVATSATTPAAVSAPAPAVSVAAPAPSDAAELTEDELIAQALMMSMQDDAGAQ